jgi:hypothetical protein
MKKLMIFAFFFGIASSFTLSARDWHCYLTPFTKYCKKQADAELVAKEIKRQVKEQKAVEKAERKAVKAALPKERHWYNLWRFWDWRTQTPKAITTPNSVVA